MGAGLPRKECALRASMSQRQSASRRSADCQSSEEPRKASAQPCDRGTDQMDIEALTVTGCPGLRDECRGCLSSVQSTIMVKTARAELRRFKWSQISGNVPESTRGFRLSLASISWNAVHVGTRIGAHVKHTVRGTKRHEPRTISLDDHLRWPPCRWISGIDIEEGAKFA